jgi:hypothetical protein
VPALTDLLVLDAAEVPHAVFQRVALLRTRLMDETPRDDRPALYSAMHGGGRFEAELNSPGNVIAAAMAKGAAALTQEDALSYACLWSWFVLAISAGDFSLMHRAVGFTTAEWYQAWLGAESLLSK